METPRRFLDLKLDYLQEFQGEPLSSIEQLSAMKKLLASCILGKTVLNSLRGL